MIKAIAVRACSACNLGVPAPKVLQDAMCATHVGAQYKSHPARKLRRLHERFTLLCAIPRACWTRKVEIWTVHQGHTVPHLEASARGPSQTSAGICGILHALHSPLFDVGICVLRALCRSKLHGEQCNSCSTELPSQGVPVSGTFFMLQHTLNRSNQLDDRTLSPI